MIKVIITSETDGDFDLWFPKHIIGLRKLERLGEEYTLELHYGESFSVRLLSEFLSEIEIHSCKDTHRDSLANGIAEYIAQLESEGISSCKHDLIGGGNWSFMVDVFRINEEWI